MMRIVKWVVLSVAVTAGSGATAEGLVGSDVAGFVEQLGTLDPLVAGELSFLSGDPDTVAGLLDVYRAEAIEAGEALALLAEAEDAHFAAMDSYPGRTSAQIDAEIASLDPAAEGYAATFERLSTARDLALASEQTLADLAARVTEAQEVYGVARAEEDAAMAVLSGGMMLSGEARAAVRAMLGL